MNIINIPIIVDLTVQGNNVAPTLIVEGNNQEVDFGLDTSISIDVHDVYEGSYEIIPLVFEDQVLETKDKLMIDNLVIKQVPNIDDYLNKIDSISVNEITQEIDENKNVNIDMSILDCGTSIIGV